MKTKQDNVNHPKHYCREMAMECLDEMEEVFGKEVVMCFCICNVWKYRYRASDKNGEEDIEKSDFYMRRYKKLKTEVQNKQSWFRKLINVLFVDDIIDEDNL